MATSFEKDYLRAIGKESRDGLNEVQLRPLIVFQTVCTAWEEEERLREKCEKRLAIALKTIALLNATIALLSNQHGGDAK